jgi:hypothetical protein
MQKPNQTKPKIACVGELLITYKASGFYNGRNFPSTPVKYRLNPFVCGAPSKRNQLN